MESQSLAQGEVKKHIAAITISNAISLPARKSWNVLLLNAYDRLLENEVYEIPLSVLADIIGYKSKDFKTLKYNITELQRTLVQWDIGGGARVRGAWVDNMCSVQMLGRVTFEDGIVFYKIDDELSKLLHSPKIYQVISLSQQKLFKTAYSLALWENTLRFIGTGTTGLSDVDEWRELLGATSKTYKEYKRFRQFVLDKAVNEINKVSDIEIALKTKKRGRRIVEIGFDIKKKDNKAGLSPERMKSIKESEQYKVLISFGIHKVKAINFIEEHGFDYIQEKIDYTQAQQKLGRIKSNPSGFLIKAIQEDYKDANKLEADKQKAEQTEKEKQAKEERRKAKIKDLKQKFSKEFGLMARENFLLSRSDEEKQKLMEEIIERCEYDDNTMASGALRKGKWDSPFIAHYINLSIPNFEEDKALYIQEKLKEAGLMK